MALPIWRQRRGHARDEDADALDASQQGAALADAGLQQLDLLRADLEPSFLRSCRLRLRFVLASCLQTRCRLATAAEIPGLLTQLDEQAEQLVRSSGSADRLQARLLQADALLDRRDFAAFQLQLRRLQPDVLLPADKTASAVLQWRALLLQNQPSDALQASVKFTETMPVPPLDWLTDSLAEQAPCPEIGRAHV